jgi:hypothetical protein
MHANPAAASERLRGEKLRVHDSYGAYSDGANIPFSPPHSAPWISSVVDGTVSNSMLAGVDLKKDHQEAKGGYWPGNAEPFYKEAGCGSDGNTVDYSLSHRKCNDWVVHVRPDAEYQFLAAAHTPPFQVPDIGMVEGEGNAGGHHGNLENEIEQWMMPVGFRPEPGDRVQMVGRWVVDCAHGWHTELHPIEAYASSHVAEDVTVASVVVTGGWFGGSIELEVWPSARPSANHTLHWLVDAGTNCAPHRCCERGYCLLGMQEPKVEALPRANPNHIRITFTPAHISGGGFKGGFNDHRLQTTVRYAAKYRLQWKP